MTDKLARYNDAAGHLEERRLASLSENRELKRTFDAQWDAVVAFCLGQGLWRFAKRVVQIDASTDVTPAFGYNNAFKLPTDWVRTVVISTSPNLDPPLLQYNEEAGYIYANATPIYLSYISNDASYGLNLGAWPESFAEYVSARLASESAGHITGKAELIDRLEKAEYKAKRNAKGLDAMNDPPGLPPVPYLVRARRGAFGPGGLWFGSGGSGDN